MAVSAGRVGLSRAGAADRGRRACMPESRLRAAAARWMEWILALGARPGHGAAMDSAWSVFKMPALTRAVARFFAGASIRPGRGDWSCSGTRHRQWAGDAEGSGSTGGADDDGARVAATLSVARPGPGGGIGGRGGAPGPSRR